MILLTVNAGSTSLKLGAFALAAGAAPEPLARARYGAPDGDRAQPLREFIARLAAPPAIVAHRIVHGGARFTAPTRIEGAVEQALGELAALAPLHNPPALAALAAARTVCADAVHVAVFDTAFFAGMPRVAAEYALPPELGTALEVRRYGFHGLAHEAMWRRWCELRPELERGGRLVTLQLGGGCSITASDRGRALDTSMGFSPLEGLVMATRSGDVDPSVIPWLAERLGITAERVLERLNREAGLLGVSGSSSEVSALLREDSERARFALELYCYRARKYLGAYLAVLGGCDGLVFGGGVGEHVPEIRARIVQEMGWAGIELEAAANAAACGAEARIGAPGSRIDVRVVPVNEEALLARSAAECVRSAAAATALRPPPASA